MFCQENYTNLLILLNNEFYRRLAELEVDDEIDPYNT
jgi:hypothetical protein